MNVVIRRARSTYTGTPGRLRTDQGFECDTLELPWKDNKRGESCIMAGTYMGWIWHSPTLGRDVIRLEDRNGRKDCMIHNGTWAGDVMADIDGDGHAGDLLTQVHGCTLTGRGYGEILRKDGGAQFGIMHSRDTLAELVAHLGPGYHSFTYVWEPGAEP